MSRNLRALTFAAALLAFGGLTREAAAQEQAARRLVIQRVNTEFEPREIHMVFTLPDGRAGESKGIFVPIVRGGEPDQPLSWKVAAYAPPGWEAEHAPILLAVTGVRGEWEVIQATGGEDSVFDPASLTESSLREYLLKRREILRSYEVQSQAQEESLKRARADADLIGDSGRVSGLRDEESRAREQFAGLTRDKESIQESLKMIRQESDPSNLPRREVELTRQVAELAQAAKQAESTEIERRSRGEADFRSKLDVIEATRFDDPRGLSDQLAKLKRRREELEESLAARTQSPVDYE